MFDTKQREYREKFSFQETFDSNCPCCVAIGDFVHIFHGNWEEDYTICSIKDNTSRNLQDYFSSEPKAKLNDVHVLKSNDCYRSSSKTLVSGFTHKRCGKHIPAVIVDIISKFCQFELFKFGGYDSIEQRVMDSFYIGTLKNGNPAEPIEWTLKPQYTLKHQLYAFGYIQHDSFIVTFGGYHIDTNAVTDDIYILDLHDNRGWIESSVKCPMKIGYDAVLDEAQRVHLFPDSLEHKLQFWIDLKDLLPH